MERHIPLRTATPDPDVKRSLRPCIQSALFALTVWAVTPGNLTLPSLLVDEGNRIDMLDCCLDLACTVETSREAVLVWSVVFSDLAAVDPAWGG